MTILNLIDLVLLVCIALAVVLVARHVRRVVNASDGLGEVNDRDEGVGASGRPGDGEYGDECGDDDGERSGIIVDELGDDEKG